jgi:hypothetical protein
MIRNVYPGSPDLDYLPITDPDPVRQKGTVSRIRNTVYNYHIFLYTCKMIKLPYIVVANLKIFGATINWG